MLHYYEVKNGHKNIFAEKDQVIQLTIFDNNNILIILMERVIKLLKNLRKKQYLALSYKHKYAFVGIGGHSINNLYPVLSYLRVPLKYIVVSSKKNAELVNANFAGVTGTNDYAEALNDAAINGVLICADPNSHFSLIKQALQKDKNVFVEKPPCKNSAELEELIKQEENSKGKCLVGLQKRYAPATAILKKKLQGDVISYNYRFVTGSHPEGDNLIDIFIHPLDFISYLFGDFTIASVQIASNNSYFIHLKHKDIVGSIELSTHYSWQDASENLIVNTRRGVYSMNNMDSLTFQAKAGTILSIPLEKIFMGNQPIEVLLNGNKFSPVQDNNQLFIFGYYSEVRNFIGLCEDGGGKNLSPLADLRLTYKLIDNIKKLN